MAVYNVREAAQALRISEMELRRRLKAREIGHVRIGRRIVLRDQDLDGFCDRHAVAVEAAGAGDGRR